MRFRGECGWSSSTAISASRRSRIGARQALGHAFRQQRPGLVSGSPYRATQHRIGRREHVLVAEPGASTCQQRGGPLEPQRLVLAESRQPFSGGSIESAQTQVLADALLMLGDRLLPAGVGMDRLGVGPQTAGPRTSGSPRRSPGAPVGGTSRAPARRRPGMRSPTDCGSPATGRSLVGRPRGRWHHGSGGGGRRRGRRPAPVRNKGAFWPNSSAAGNITRSVSRICQIQYAKLHSMDRP